MGRAAPAVGERADDGLDSASGSPVVHVPLTVAAVAARLGVAPSTLRTWDRRYGLGPSGRSAGSHRRYTSDDVARLETMRRLTLAGAAPSDAARAAMRSITGAPASLPFAPAVDSPGASARVDGLTLAAAAIDGEEPRVRRLVAAAVRGWGVVGAWAEVAQPAFGFLADRVSADRPGRDPDHLLFGAILAVVRSVAESAETGARRVVVCADRAVVVDRLGAHVIAAGLAERGVGAAVLVGPASLEKVVGTIEGPRGVVVVVGHHGGGEELARAVSESGAATVIVVGAEAPVVWLPEVQRVRTYAGALHEIVGALGAGPGSDPTPPGLQEPS